ncbi:hypothetical protein BJX62DRAFT_242944 [Aspergillus germanicus]
MALELNLCEVILIMIVLGPKMLWNSIRSGSLKRSIKRRLEARFAPVIEYRERRTRLSFRPRLRRALTPPPPSSSLALRRGSGRSDMQLEMQTESGFFKLPIELRQIVYCEVLCVSSIHLHKYDGIAKVHGGLCTGTQRVRNLWLGYDRAPPDHYMVRSGHMVQPYLYQPEPAHPGIGLLRVCRRIYSEAINILYEQNTFSLNVHALNALPRTIIPTRLASIRTLRVYVSITTAHDRAKWIHASQILKKLSALRSLHASFARIDHPTDGSPKIKLRDGFALVKPLLDLRVPDFVVEVPQSAISDGLVVRDPPWADTPFRVRLWERW